MADGSNGYEAAAGEFMRGRNPAIGVDIVRAWAHSLTPGATVLDLGCGNGIPVTQALVDAGLAVHALDASPTMISAFRENFPGVPAVCERADESGYFGRRFDGIVAWGLMFLMPADLQIEVIQRLGAALEAGGSFLFTAPKQPCGWDDVLTGRASVSLGAAAYRAHLADAGLMLVAEHRDAGDNHYFESRKQDVQP